MEQSPAVNQESQNVPGIGISGVVMCPYFKGPCLKSGCELWVELTYGTQKVGRCSHSFNTINSVELKQEIRELKEILEKQFNKGLNIGS